MSQVTMSMPREGATDVPRVCEMLRAVVVGIVGAFIGGWLFTHMGWHAPWTGLAGTIFVAFIGALVLLAILHLLHAATYRRPVY